MTGNKVGSIGANRQSDTTPGQITMHEIMNAIAGMRSDMEAEVVDEWGVGSGERGI